MEQYYIRARGKILGPFDLNRIMLLRQRGRLGRGHEISTDKQTWQRISQLRELAEPADRDDESLGFTLLEEAQLESGTQSGVASPDSNGAGDPVNWHFHDGAQQVGPVTFKVLRAMAKAGKLLPQNLVWQEGFSSWVPASTIEDLFDRELPRERQSPAARQKVAKAAQREEQSEFNSVWDALLDHVRKQFSPEFLENVTSLSITVGGWAALVATLVAPAIAFFFAVKTDSFRLALVAVTLMFGMAILRYVAIRMCLAIGTLIRASQSRLHSRAFLDCLALLWFLLYVALSTWLLYFWMLSGTSGVDETIVMVEGIVGMFLTGGLAACMALQSKWMNVECDPDALAGEEGVGILAFFVKQSLRNAVLYFGYGTFIGTVGLIVAGILLLAAGDSNDVQYARAMALLFFSSARVGISIVLPVVAYGLGAVAFILLDLAQAVLQVPRKLDELAAGKSET